ncbi:MAG: phosphotransferase [Bacteroidota bacterium]
MDFLLNADHLSALQNFLLQRKWIAPAEELISASKPGEGNMNYVLRIRTNFRTFIVKQSRDYVEKYPQIPAPRERVVIEGQFYELIQEDELLRAYTPELSYLDEANSLIVLEDLGESTDFSFLYQKSNQIEGDDLKEIVHFLSVLHNRFNTDFVDPSIVNMSMRELNAEHIFNFPFMENNGLNLDDVTPGLQAVAMKYKQDQALKKKVKELSTHYLNDGNTLLHGDYYPGSWLKTLDSVKIIDPEFCFFGPAEFDLSVMLAHMKMAQQSPELIQMVLDRYETPKKFDWTLVKQLEGVEIQRRLIGLAQLPVALDLDEKTALLEEAFASIME